MDEKIRILGVDDCYENRDAISVLLRQEGYDVYDAESGEKALGFIDSCAPQIFIIDVRMPDMSGLELLQKIAVEKNTPPRHYHDRI